MEKGSKMPLAACRRISRTKKRRSEFVRISKRVFRQLLDGDIKTAIKIVEENEKLFRVIDRI